MPGEKSQKLNSVSTPITNAGFCLPTATQKNSTLLTVPMITSMSGKIRNWFTPPDVMIFRTFLNQSKGQVQIYLDPRPTMAVEIDHVQVSTIDWRSKSEMLARNCIRIQKVRSAQCKEQNCSHWKVAGVSPRQWSTWLATGNHVNSLWEYWTRSFTLSKVTGSRKNFRFRKIEKSQFIKQSINLKFSNKCLIEPVLKFQDKPFYIDLKDDQAQSDDESLQFGAVARMKCPNKIVKGNATETAPKRG